MEPGAPMPPWWTPWAALPLRRKILRAAAVAFFLWHVAAMFTMGGTAPIRRVVGPVFGLYGDRMKMTNTWGMFSRRPTSTHVRIEAVDARGEAHLLSTTESTGKGIFERFRDARLRKIQSKLGSKKDRNRFGAAYLDGWCRVEGVKVEDVRETRAVQVIHELRDDRGRVVRKPSEKVVLRRSCGRLRPSTLPVREEKDDDVEGDDS